MFCNGQHFKSVIPYPGPRDISAKVDRMYPLGICHNPFPPDRYSINDKIIRSAGLWGVLSKALAGVVLR